MVDEHGSAGALVEAMRDYGGSWWSVLPAGELLALYTPTDDTYYRAHYTFACREHGGGDFDRVRAAYLLGHVAGLDPEYSGRAWSDVEPELARGWRAATERSWDAVSGFAQSAFMRSASAKEESWRTRLPTSDAAWNAA